MIVKCFGCTAIHNKKRYINASFIHSFIQYVPQKSRERPGLGLKRCK